MHITATCKRCKLYYNETLVGVWAQSGELPRSLNLTSNGLRTLLLLISHSIDLIEHLINIKINSFQMFSLFSRFQTSVSNREQKP